MPKETRKIELKEHLFCTSKMFEPDVDDHCVENMKSRISVLHYLLSLQNELESSFLP